MGEESHTIDREIFNELREVMGEDLEMLVQAFIRDGEQRMQTLREALNAADHDTFRQTAHSFKGSSSNLGAAELAERCYNLQETPVDHPQVPAMLEELGQSFAAACSELERLLNRG